MTRFALLMVGLWSCVASATPASAALLRVLYPGFDRSGYRADGRRLGWTQVQPWKAHEHTQVVLVEKLAAEGGAAPAEMELAVVESNDKETRVLARWTGWKSYASPENCSPECPKRVVGLDLGEFPICADEVALGVVTERRDGDSVLRELALFRFKEGALTPLGRFPKRERRGDTELIWTWKLLARRGEACRDLLLTLQGGEPPMPPRRFRWSDGGYQEEAAAKR
jgi:hypothetical protein